MFNPGEPDGDSMKKILRQIVDVFRKNHGMKSGQPIKASIEMEASDECNDDEGCGVDAEPVEVDEPKITPVWGNGIMKKMMGGGSNANNGVSGSNKKKSRYT